MLTQQTVQGLHAMGLRSMATAYHAQLTDPDVQGLSFDERLGLLVDREWTDRQNRRLSRRLQDAHLRSTVACVEDIDYEVARGLDRSLMRTLAEGRWISEHQNVLLTGPCGVGKTFAVCALANAACRRGFRARYYRASALVSDLALARGDGSRPKLLGKLARTDLLAIDDWGLATLSVSEARDLLDVIDDRCQSGSTLIASQLPIDNWHSVMPDPSVADAVLDRLVHGAYHIALRGESMRKLRAHVEHASAASPESDPGRER
ncbi:MAG: IS21-like element helper ATPase IstB [Solirubrobacteraceae bacterium]